MLGSWIAASGLLLLGWSLASRQAPNRPDDPQYIVRLLARVITVSLETVQIVKALPSL